MALTPQHKAVVDGMDNIDKSLLLLYILGKDDTGLAIGLGNAMVRAYYPEHDPDELANEHLALAILKANYNYNRDIFLADLANIEAEAARLAALESASETMNPDNDIGDMPLPPEETT